MEQSVLGDQPADADVAHGKASQPAPSKHPRITLPKIATGKVANVVTRRSWRRAEAVNAAGDAPVGVFGVGPGLGCGP
jgi:hypothetical protein